MACRNPNQVKNANQGLRMVSAALNTISPAIETPITRRRCVQPGCRMTIHMIHTPAATATPTVMPTAPALGLCDST